MNLRALQPQDEKPLEILGVDTEEGRIWEGKWLQQSIVPYSQPSKVAIFSR